MFYNYNSCKDPGIIFVLLKCKTLQWSYLDTQLWKNSKILCMRVSNIILMYLFIFTIFFKTLRVTDPFFNAYSVLPLFSYYFFPNAGAQFIGTSVLTGTYTNIQNKGKIPKLSWLGVLQNLKRYLLHFKSISAGKCELDFLVLGSPSYGWGAHICYEGFSSTGVRSSSLSHWYCTSLC